MTDDAHPDRPVPTREPARVARFDLTDQPRPDPAADKALADGPADGPADQEQAVDGVTAPRVARFDGLRSSPAEGTRVADFGDLDADDGGRPLAPVIRLDSVGSRRGSAALRYPNDPAPPRTSGSASDEEEALSRTRRPDPEQPRSGRVRRRALPPPPGGGPAGGVERHELRRSVEADRSGDGAPADEDAAGEQTTHGIPPDGPLPRGRRKGARPGRLGPDAPDPELPLPEADPVAIAREICLRLLTDRARTRQELAQALARKGVPEEATAAVLDRFAEVGLIDDAAFAGQWVRSRHTYRGLGRRAIAVELRRKGVADGVAKEALAEVDAESEDRRARELVDRKLRSMSVGTADQRATAARRLVGMLARKGYGAGTAYRVVREALAEHGADIDELSGGGEHDE